MRLFIILSKKTLCVILASLVIILILLGQLFTIRAGGIDGSTNALRYNYIEGLGYSIDETPIQTKEIIIPEKFSDVYENYNKTQKQAGFDLSDFKGKNACVYTYKPNDSDDFVINIIVSGKYIIGGDISSVRINGEMKPLERKSNGKNAA